MRQRHLRRTRNRAVMITAAAAAAVLAVGGGVAAVTLTGGESAEKPAAAPAEAPERDTPTGVDAPAAAEKAEKAEKKADRTSAAPEGSPVARHGKLEVCGVNLCNADGEPVQLRGMSSHGIQFFPDCLNETSITALREDWKSDFVRIAMYVQEGGFETDPVGFTEKVNEAVEIATDLGLYAIVDFHILNPGDPNFNLDNAKQFFADVTAEHADKENVIYEVANEPNGVSWDEIKSYAEEVIPVIRKNVPDSVVIVGTRAWSSLGVSEGADESEVVENPVDAENIMYAFHFYAASHKDNYREVVDRAAEELPLFVSEFGTQEFTGDGPNDFESTDAWLDLFREHKIGYAMWSYSDSDDTNSAFKPGTCGGDDYSSDEVLSESGAYIKERISSAAE